MVTGIAGAIHGDVTIEGRADHAGATPMSLRRDPLVTAAETIAELDALTRRTSDVAVGTVGEIAARPGLINVIPGEATFSLDLRSVSGDHIRIFETLLADLRAARRRARPARPLRRAPSGRPARRWTPRSSTPSVPPPTRPACAGAELPSGAAHDTMLVARRVPSAMVFVPCVDGISHAPDEQADPYDAAVGAHVMLEAIERLQLSAAGGPRP